jgi:putative transposase
MEPQAECMLVLIGATPEGKKELLGFHVGVRESAQSWRELLVDPKARGLAIVAQCGRAGSGPDGNGRRPVWPGVRRLWRLREWKYPRLNGIG